MRFTYTGLEHRRARDRRLRWGPGAPGSARATQTFCRTWRRSADRSAKETCDRSKTTKTEAWSSASDAGAVLKSEDQEDFFFRSELRLHVLHAIGLMQLGVVPALFRL